MIRFQYIKWRNFLSTGNQFSEIQLNRSSTTLVVGANGGGKSTFIDAICFGLFNKPFRNINKGQLVNSINRKECEVEIGFIIGTKNYKVVRGIKPNKFEIYLDGELINQDAANRDYQEYLEETILKLNYKSFTQMSILGAANYTPFMQLPAATRREVIEDLLDISVFSRMNEVLKKKINNNKEELSIVEKDLEVAKVKLESQDKIIENIQKNNKERISQIDSNIEESKKTIKENEDKILHSDKLYDFIDYSIIDSIKEKQAKKEEKKNKLLEIKERLLIDKKTYALELEKPLVSSELDNIQSIIEEQNKLLGIIKEEKDAILLVKRNFVPLKFKNDTEYEAINKEIENFKFNIDKFKDINKEDSVNRQKLIKDNEFYENHEECPTCNQDIDNAFRKNKLNDNKKAISDIENILLTNEDKIKELKESIELNEKKLSEIEERVNNQNIESLSKLENNINFCQSRIDEINDKINEEKQKKRDIEKKLNDERNVYMKELDTALEDVRLRIDTVQEEIDNILAEYKKENIKIDAEKATIFKEISIAENNIQSENAYISKLLKEKESIELNVGNIKDEINKKNEIESDILKLETDVNIKYEEKKYFDIILNILKDNGIKTMIIKQYVPIINKLVNSYLQTQDLFVQFELDETFNESIKSRHRDDFSYTSFSEGEKARIDISILLAFRSIARMKSTSSTDLLLLDETFDSSIDADGSDALSNILKTLQDTYVFVISHNEKLFDKFRSIIKFNKINNYSVIA